MGCQIQQRTSRMERVGPDRPLSQLMVCTLQISSPGSDVSSTAPVAWEEKLCRRSVFRESHPAQKLSTAGGKLRVRHVSSDLLLPTQNLTRRSQKINAAIPDNATPLPCHREKREISFDKCRGPQKVHCLKEPSK